MRRNLKEVPVVDDDGNFLHNVSHETAIEEIRTGRAHSVKGKAIRMKRAVVVFRAGSLECKKEFIEKYGAEARG